MTLTRTGGKGTVTTTASGTTCGWTATSAVAWVTLTATSYTGSARVSYPVAKNATGVDRIGTVTIAGKTFTVIQTAK